LSIPELRFIACDIALARDLADLKALVHVGTSQYPARMVDVMLREGHYERRLFRLRRRLKAPTARTLQLLDDLGADVFTRPANSPYPWPAFRRIDDTVALARELMPGRHGERCPQAQQRHRRTAA
jgi:DNA-binding transcriptional MocR family regulator